MSNLKMLIIICGLQRTGKTTVAKKIAEKIDGALLRTDILRKELTDRPRYSEEERQRAYNEMFSRAEKLLGQGKDVILDATFVRKEDRNKAKILSGEENFKIIETICPEEIVKKRFEKAPKNESEANFETYLKYKETFEPVTEDHIVIDTSQDVDAQLEKFF